MVKPPFIEVLKAIPVLRLFPGLIAGILLGRHLQFINTEMALFACAVVFLLILLIYRLRLFFSMTSSWLRGWMITIFYFTVGLSLSCFVKQEKVIYTSQFWYAELTDYPLEKQNSFLLKLKIISSPGQKELKCTGTRVSAWSEKKDAVYNLKPGERIIFHAQLESPVNAGNPEEFDYASWLMSHGISHQCYLKWNQWTSFPPEKIPLRYFPLLLKKKVMDRIEKQKCNPGSGEVMMAISLGSRNQLDKDMKQSYADAGAVHVMAVSGLHVGMVWMALSYVLVFFRKGKMALVVRFLIISIILWTYAVITGLSPSVCRSCLMFTLVGFGGLFERNTAVFNTVLLAAFLQILVKPNILWDVGFQFSYAAVFSIILFHNRIHHFISFDLPGINFFSNLTSVSLSAQILTFPLAIFYFHQFPSYFLLTNLLIIPLVTALMITFLASMAFFPISAISTFLIKSGLFITNLMNQCVHWIESLPGSVMRDIPITLLQLIILLVIPLILLLFIEYKKAGSLIIIQLLLLIHLGIGLYSKYEHAQKEEVIVYNIPQILAVSCRNGMNNILLTASSEEILTPKLAYACSGYWIKNHYPPPKIFNILEGEVPSFHGIWMSRLPGNGNLIVLNDKISVIIIHDPAMLIQFSSVRPITTDLLILSGKRSLKELDKLDELIHYRKVVIASSVPAWETMQKNNGMEDLNIFDVRSMGANILKVKGKR